MPQASLAFLSTGLWRAMNPPSQKHRCFPNREGRQKEMKCLAQHHTGNLRPSPAPSSALRSNHSRAPLPADQGKRKKKKTETRISTHSQMTTLNTLGATQVLLPTVSPRHKAGSILNINCQGWALSSSCLPVPVLFTWNRWSWCPTIKLRPAHDVFTMSDWEILTEIFIVPKHGTGKCPGHQY